MKIVIIGGVAGGATAATRARRLSEEAEIILFERSPYVSYATCGLPYYIGSEIAKRDDLFVASPELLERRYRLDIRQSQEVLHINREKKEVEVKDLSTGKIYRESYDKLILSPGARPKMPPISGIELDRIFTLRDMADTDRLKSYLKQNHVRSALVVGGGFIGLETAENLSRLGVKVTILEMLDQVLPSLDYEMAAIVHRHLYDQDLDLHLGDAVSAFLDRG